MNKKYVPFIFIILLCIGLFMLGKGITGGVVSQSCCYGQNCHPDYVCDVYKAPDSSSFFGFGTVIVLSSAILFVVLHSRSNFI